MLEGGWGGGSSVLEFGEDSFLLGRLVFLVVDEVVIGCW